MTSDQPRYPGTRSFADDELSRRLFYGRAREASALTVQVLAHRLVVLFAVSGIGKTSLINAGMSEVLRSHGILPLMVRVNDPDEGALASVYKGIATACLSQNIEYVPGDTRSLWHFFKTVQFWRGNELLVPLLILDQFEEIFTLQSEPSREQFFDQFSHVVRGIGPDEPGGENLSASPPAVKVLISLREDFVANLEELSERVPDILSQRFRLLPLDREGATLAVEGPATLQDAALRTRPFVLAPLARDRLLDFLESRERSTLRRPRSRIEPFQLQLMCQHVEALVEVKARHQPGTDQLVVAEADIGDDRKLDGVLSKFYIRQVAAVKNLFQRRAVFKLCGEHLVSPQGRRLRMEESEIARLAGVREKTLAQLVESRVLRVDRTLDGNYYELSHDSMIGPVVASRRLWWLLRLAAGIVTLSLLGLITIIMVISMLDGAGAQSSVGEWIGRIFVLLVVGSPGIYYTVKNARALREAWRRLLLKRAARSGGT